MIVGMTGGRKRPTEAQIAFLERNLADATVLRHGCCVGSDWEAHRIAVRDEGMTIWCHPPVNTGLAVPVTRLVTRPGIHVLRPKGYLERDRDIVDNCDVLIATPNGPYRPGSGTWYTVDYANARKRAVVVCLPDGSIDPGHST